MHIITESDSKAISSVCRYSTLLFHVEKLVDVCMSHFGIFFVIKIGKVECKAGEIFFAELCEFPKCNNVS
jgi:hypothetical protein